MTVPVMVRIGALVVATTAFYATSARWCRRRKCSLRPRSC